MRHKKLLVFVTIGAATLATGFAVAHRGEAGGPPSVTPHSTFSVEAARAFKGFPIYNAGDSFDGSPLVAVLRRDDSANYVSFIYGECKATDDVGCAPPAEVQVWPACKRNLSLYTPPGSPAPQTAVVRGVRAAFFDDGQRLEIQTGISTVVIFAVGQEQALQAADALRGVNVPVAIGVPLPPPAAGAIAGTLSCPASVG